MDVLKRINQLNNERNWSYYALSEASGVAASTISSWYSKNMVPSIPTLEKLCKGYGITMAQFFLPSSAERPDLSDEQKHLLDEWELLSPTGKERLLTVIHWMQEPK